MFRETYTMYVGYVYPNISLKKLVGSLTAWYTHRNWLVFYHSVVQTGVMFMPDLAWVPEMFGDNLTTYATYAYSFHCILEP